MATSKPSMATILKDLNKFPLVSEVPQLSAAKSTILRLQTALFILRRTHEVVLALKVGRQRRRFCNWSSVFQA